MNNPEADNHSTPDAVTKSWVNRMPPGIIPYLRLMRADRPIGTWLLLWPCWWSITLAADYGSWPDIKALALFAIGAFVMRGAGCTLNDILDRDFDAKVERTRARPIPSGQVSVRQAIIFMVTLCLVGLVILLQFNGFAVAVGAASLALVAIYPLMKRITYWPQAVLGLTFNWGALLGWAAIRGEISTAPLLLYAGGICWTLGYDTIYAHQDKEDDLLVGVKSTALRLGDNTVPWLFAFYGAALFLFLEAGRAADTGWAWYVAIAALGAQLVWQIGAVNTDDSASCLKVFRSNTYAGWIVFIGALAGKLLS